MSKSRIKKHKGVKLVDTRHPPPKDDDEEEKLLTCIMCNCMTIEEYLKRHIRYNHLISKEEIIDKLYNLHYPAPNNSVATQTTATWARDADKGGKSPDHDSHKGKARVPPKNRPGRTQTESDDDEPNDRARHSRKDMSKNGNRMFPKRQNKDVSDEEEVLCPACGDVEDGTPMIACDLCDRWYHWACVGLMCKPQKGKEWICTECSSNKPGRKGHHHNMKNELGVASGSGKNEIGVASGSGKSALCVASGSGMKQKKVGGLGLKKNDDDVKVTAVIKPRRDGDASGDKISERRTSMRGKRSPSFDRPSGPSRARKRYSSSEHESPQRKVPTKLRKQSSESEPDDRDDNNHDDLRYSDDTVGDGDFEPNESDYDEKDMRLGGKVGERRESAQHKFKKFKKKNVKHEVEYDNMSRDDLRELCHKEMINATGNRDELEKRLRRHFKKKQENTTSPPKKDLKKYKLTEIVEGDGVCKICGHGWELTDELELGPLYKYGGCQAHLHCLMFSSGLIQGGEESEGIVGFMPEDVIREWQRGAKLKCCFCKEIYATVGCCQRTCMRTYHLPCGIKYGALNEYYGNFDSYCPLHRSKRAPKTKSKKSKNYVLTDLGLVPELVDMESGFDSERYKAMMRKVESETAEKRKSEEKTDRQEEEARNTSMLESPEEEAPVPVKKEKRRSDSSDHTRDSRQSEFGGKTSVKAAKRKSYRNTTSSDEEPAEIQKKRPGPKSKTLNKTPKSNEGLRETKSEPETLPRREERSKRARKSTFGDGDIYKSAKDELAKMLERKHPVNINDTFGDLAGTRRRVVRVTSVADEDDDKDFESPDKRSSSRSRSRSGRKSAKKAVVEVDDEEDFGSKTFASKIPYTRKSLRNSPQKEEEEEKPKDDETIESIEEFLTDTESKEKSSSVEKEPVIEKEIENSESGEENSNESPPTPTKDQSKTPPTPNLSENEFEDAERDSGQENLDQNDGFTDCADLSNVTSDEGTDLDTKRKSKTMFNDDDADDQLDLTNLIQNLEEDEEIKEYDCVKSLKRFKCPFCPHHSKEKRRVEQHITYAHKKGNFNKNMARGQQMMVFIENQNTPKKEKSKALTQLKDFNDTSTIDEITEMLPCFRFSSDETTEMMLDKEEATRQNWSTYLQKLNKIVKQASPKRNSNSSSSPSESSKLQDNESYRLSDSSGFVNKTEVIDKKRERRKPNLGDDFVWDDPGKKSPKPQESSPVVKSESPRKKKVLFQPQLFGTEEDKKKEEGCENLGRRETRSKKEAEHTEGSPKSKRHRSGSLSSNEGVPESMFECLKCGTKIKLTKDLVMNHLKRHKLSLKDYKDTYIEESNEDLIKTINDWNTEDPLSDTSQKPFKLLFSTVGEYDKEDSNKPEKNCKSEAGQSVAEDEESAGEEKAVALSKDKVEKIVLRIKNVKS